MKIISKFKLFEEKDLKAIPQGWVNVKIDQQIEIRLRRYIEVLDNYLISIGEMRVNEKGNLFKKIEALSNADRLISNPRTSIQTKLSIVTILQYLNEIRSNFNASTGGFLIESLIASLIHGKPLHDRGKVDIIGKKEVETDKLKYQIKLYKKNSDCNIEFPENKEKRCDYYVICYKSDDRIEIIILDGKNESDSSYIENFCKKVERITTRTSDKVVKDQIFKYTKQKNPKRFVTLSTKIIDSNFEFKKIIEFGRIDSIIESCGRNIQETITKLYDDISQLQYLSETIITGYNPELKTMTVDQAKQQADKIIDDIRDDIEGLSSELY
jgi:hypothetical protein